MKSFYLIIGLMLIVGCGGTDSSPKEERLRLPKKISIDIPEILTSEENRSREDYSKINKELQEKKISEDEDVKYYTLFLKIIPEWVKLKMFVVENGLPDAVEFCKDTPLNSVCKIPDNTISFSLDEQMADDIVANTEANFYSFDIRNFIGYTFNLGSIEFVQYDNNHPYQYAFIMDSSMDIVGKALKQRVTFRWSSDHNLFYASNISTYEGDGSKELWTLHYQNIPKIEENLRMTSQTLGFSDKPNNSITFNLTQKEDENSSFIAKFDYIDDSIFAGEPYSQREYQYIKLTKNGGAKFMVSTEELGSDAFVSKEIDVFDKTGDILQTKSCETNSTECDIDDASQWETPSIFNPIESIIYQELQIKGANLKDGEYFLFPPEYNISNLTIAEALNDNVGEFVVLGHSRQGLLYDGRYLDKLDKLQVVYGWYNRDVDVYRTDIHDISFEVLKEEDLPVLEL